MLVGKSRIQSSAATTATAKGGRITAEIQGNSLDHGGLTAHPGRRAAASARRLATGRTRTRTGYHCASAESTAVPGQWKAHDLARLRRTLPRRRVPLLSNARISAWSYQPVPPMPVGRVPRHCVRAPIAPAQEPQYPAFTLPCSYGRIRRDHDRLRTGALLLLPYGGASALVISRYWRAALFTSCELRATAASHSALVRYPGCLPCSSSSRCETTTALVSPAALAARPSGFAQPRPVGRL